MIVWEDNECIMIVPLVYVATNLRKCDVRLRGYDNGNGLLDILYSNKATYADFKMCMDACVKELKKV